MPNDPQATAAEAKAIVALAFRNGPIEDVHAGLQCPTCSNDPTYSRISQTEMKDMMKYAVNRVYSLLLLRDTQRHNFDVIIKEGGLWTSEWDEPKPVPPHHI